MSDNSNSPNSDGEVTSRQAVDGSLNVQQPKSGSCDELDGKAKGGPVVVQQKGRFKVTSEDLDVEKAAPSPVMPKSHSMQVITQQQGVTLPPPSMDIAATQHVNPVIKSLLTILQENIVQRDLVLNVMKQIAAGDTTGNYEGGTAPLPTNLTEKSLLDAAQAREKELMREITELQLRLILAQEELNKYKMEHGQVNDS